MELTACIVGLSEITDCVDLSVGLYTDSNYVQQGITTWIKGWKKNGWKSTSGPVKNKELWIKLDKLVSSFNDIEVIKVKGHADNKGNIIADRLVNEAMDEYEKGCEKFEIKPISTSEGNSNKLNEEFKNVTEYGTIAYLKSHVETLQDRIGQGDPRAKLYEEQIAFFKNAIDMCEKYLRS